MPNYLTTLRCTKKTAAIFFLTITALFILIGCASLFRTAGLSPEQAALEQARLETALTDATAAAIARVQIGLAEGQDLKTVALDASSAFIWKIATAAAAVAGTVLSTLLTKWLGTERKISKALITGVEDAPTSDVKASIKRNATAAGVETKLHARVKALT